jgi:hypothetical protein
MEKFYNKLQLYHRSSALREARGIFGGVDELLALIRKEGIER